jgi:hypothetical protein
MMSLLTFVALFNLLTVVSFLLGALYLHLNDSHDSERNSGVSSLGATFAGVASVVVVAALAGGAASLVA